MLDWWKSGRVVEFSMKGGSSCEQREQVPGVRDQGDDKGGYQELISGCTKGYWGWRSPVLGFGTREVCEVL